MIYQLTEIVNFETREVPSKVLMSSELRLGTDEIMVYAMKRYLLFCLIYIYINL